MFGLYRKPDELPREGYGFGVGGRSDDMENEDDDNEDDDNEDEKKSTREKFRAALVSSISFSTRPTTTCPTSHYCTAR